MKNYLWRTFAHYREYYINKNHLDVINDYTYFEKNIVQKKEEEKQSIITLIFIKTIYPIYYIYKTSEPFKPNEIVPKTIRAMEIFMIFFVIVFYSFVVLYTDINDTIFTYINLFLLIFFILASLVQLHTGIYNKGKITLSKKKIFDNYRQSHLFIDLIGIIIIALNLIWLSPKE